MGIEALCAAIESRARSGAEELLRRAYAEAGRLRREAEADEERRLDRLLAERERELRREAQRVQSRAHRLARERVLRERARRLEEILERARSRLPAACESRAYRTALPARLEQALSHVRPPAQIECTPGLAPLLKRSLTNLRHVTVVPSATVATGFWVVAGEGRIVVDATLEGMLTQRWESLRVGLVKRIDEEAR